MTSCQQKSLSLSLRKQWTFCNNITGFRNFQWNNIWGKSAGNSILMIYYYSDLGSASDPSYHEGNLPQWIKSTTWIWGVACNLSMENYAHFSQVSSGGKPVVTLNTLDDISLQYVTVANHNLIWGHLKSNNNSVTEEPWFKPLQCIQWNEVLSITNDNWP